MRRNISWLHDVYKTTLNLLHTHYYTLVTHIDYFRVRHRLQEYVNAIRDETGGLQQFIGCLGDGKAVGTCRPTNKDNIDYQRAVYTTTRSMAGDLCTSFFLMELLSRLLVLCDDPIRHCVKTVTLTFTWIRYFYQALPIQTVTPQHHSCAEPILPTPTQGIFDQHAKALACLHI